MDSTIEKDKAIAYFLGWRIDNSYPDKDKVWRSPAGDLELDTTFKFKTDFNALMNIVDELNKIGDYEIRIRDKQCILYTANTIINSCHSELDTLDAVYNCLASHIMIHNQSLLKRKSQDGI